MTVLQRITDSNTDSSTKLKVFGDQNVAQLVPNLRRVRSLVDEDSSSLLVDSALRVIFRSFDTFSRQQATLAHFQNPGVFQRIHSSLSNEGSFDSTICEIMSGKLKHKEFKAAKEEELEDGSESECSVASNESSYDNLGGLFDSFYEEAPPKPVKKTKKSNKTK